MTVGHDAAWLLHAACAGTPTEVFFTGRGPELVNHGVEAKALCARCPVLADCLGEAIATGQEHGIWGGCAIRGPVGRRLKRLARTSLHGPVDVGDGCLFCDAVDQHRVELRRAFGRDGEPVHGRWETFKHANCRCLPCSIAHRRHRVLAASGGAA